MSAQSVILGKRLDKLRTQYQDNVKSMDQMRADYEKSVSIRLENMQKEMQKKLSEYDEDLRIEYEKELEKFSEELSRELETRIDAINREYVKLKNENDDMRAQMKLIEKELSDELHGISSRLDVREQTMKNEAQKRMEKAYDDFQRFSVSYPHEFFEPNAADALLMQMESVKVDFRSGFYEACMASSSGIEFQIASLEDRMKKGLQQWTRYFNQLESYTLMADEYINSNDFSVISNDFFEKELLKKSERDADTFDYWSYNQYSEVVEQLQKHIDFIKHINDMPGESKENKITSFLKKERRKGSCITFEDLSEKINEITVIHKKICSMRVFIHTGFEASFQRATVLSKEIIRVLSEERQGEIIKKGFRDNDIRNEFTIVSKEPGKNITVQIFPVSPDRMSVVNAIGIFTEHTGSGTVDNLKITEEQIVNMIKSISSGTMIISANNRDEGVSDSEKAMNNIKKQADEKRKKELSSRRRMR